MAELHYGVEKSQQVERNKHALEKFILPLEVLEFDQKASEKYGEIRNFLERKGSPIGAMDLLIASHALSMDVILITNNVREFARIPHLKLENWFQ